MHFLYKNYYSVFCGGLPHKFRFSITNKKKLGDKNDLHIQKM